MFEWLLRCLLEVTVAQCVGFGIMRPSNPQYVRDRGFKMPVICIRHESSVPFSLDNDSTHRDEKSIFAFLWSPPLGTMLPASVSASTRFRAKTYQKLSEIDNSFWGLIDI
jgi:hypothetical protein